MALALQTSTTPWSTWSFSEEFFEGVNLWNENHPETTFEKVLNRICDGADTASNLSVLIPNSPFPARDLATGLFHLVKLGSNVRGVQRDIVTFVKGIGQWVSRESLAFQAVAVGHESKYLKKTWDNLEEIHDLIEEICQWATQRLAGGLSKRILQSLFVGKELDDFKKRITGALSRFMQLSVIGISEGQDVILHELYLNAGKLQIYGAVSAGLMDRLDKEARIRYIKETLGSRLAPNSSYFDQSKGFCAKNTRSSVLSEVQEWIMDFSNTTSRFIWLTGHPGAGKSSIMATLCRDVRDKKLLWAQFFINRGYLSTTDPNCLFPTIAYQLAVRSTDLALQIENALKQRPSLVDIISSEQAEKLFLEPLIYAAEHCSPSEAIVIGIDGLDELDTKRLAFVVTTLVDVFAKLPNNVKVILSSRVEAAIKTGFSYSVRPLPYRQIDLETTDTKLIDDVDLIIKREMKYIAMEFALDPGKWPGKEQLKKLCTQASGLFIWAVTALSFIREMLTESGLYQDNVDIVAKLLQDGLQDINMLYQTILNSTYGQRTELASLQLFQFVVGAIVVLKEPFSLAELAGLLSENGRQTTIIPNDDTPDSETLTNIMHITQRLRTVLVAGTDDVSQDTIPHLHKSFYSFITSDHSDSRFRIDKFRANKVLAFRCLRDFQGFTGQVETPGDLPGDIQVEKYSKYLNASITCYDAFLADDRVVPGSDMAYHLHFLSIALLLRANREDADRAYQTCQSALNLTLKLNSKSSMVAAIDVLNKIIPKALIHRDLNSHNDIPLATTFDQANHDVVKRPHRMPDVPATISRWFEKAYHSVGNMNHLKPSQATTVIDTLCKILPRVMIRRDAAARASWASQFEASVQQIPKSHRDMPEVLNAWAKWILFSFTDLANINRAIVLQQEAVQLLSVLKEANARDTDNEEAYNLQQSKLFGSLAFALSQRFAHTADIEDLNWSIRACEAALHHLPYPKLTDEPLSDSTNDPKERNRILLLISLSHPLSVRIELQNSLADLERSISLSEELLKLVQPGTWSNFQKYFQDSLMYDGDLRNQFDLALPAHIPDDHPDKPSLLPLIGKFYPRFANREKASLQLAILFLRKFGYPKRRHLWKYSPTAMFNAQNPEKLEKDLTRQLIELQGPEPHQIVIARRFDLNQEYRIVGDLDHELFDAVCWRNAEGEITLKLSDFDNVRYGPVLRPGNANNEEDLEVSDVSVLPEAHTPDEKTDDNHDDRDEESEEKATRLDKDILWTAPTQDPPPVEDDSQLPDLTDLSAWLKAAKEIEDSATDGEDTQLKAPVDDNSHQDTRLLKTGHSTIPVEKLSASEDDASTLVDTPVPPTALMSPKPTSAFPITPSQPQRQISWTTWQPDPNITLTPPESPFLSEYLGSNSILPSQDDASVSEEKVDEIATLDIDVSPRAHPTSKPSRNSQDLLIYPLVIASVSGLLAFVIWTGGIARLADMAQNSHKAMRDPYQPTSEVYNLNLE